VHLWVDLSGPGEIRGRIDPPPRRPETPRVRGTLAAVNLGWGRSTVLLALLLAQSPRIATAQAVDAFSYEANDPRCPTQDEARERLREALVAVPPGDLPPIEASISIVSAESGYVATVVLREDGYDDQRVLADPDCAVLAEAATLVVAIALAPGLGMPSVDVPAPETHALALEPELDPTPPPVSSVHGSLWLAAHGSYGVLPGAAIGVELAGSLAIESLRLDLAIRGLPFVDARFPTAPSLGGNVAELVGLLRARGVGLVVEHLELAAGGGLEAGAILGTGVGISDPRSTAGPWLALEAAAGISWVPWHDVAFFLEIEAIVPVVRPVFSVAGVGVLYRPEPIAGALRVGIEVRTP